MRSRFRTPFQLLGAFVLFLSPHRRVEEILVVFTDAEIDRDQTVARLVDILNLLGQVDERSLALVKRYVRHIAIWKGHYTAYDSLGGIQFSSSWLADSSDLYLASVLVHEATHLRIYGFGINYAADKRTRIEHRCVKQQVAFLRRVPLGETYAAELEVAVETPWWTDQAHRHDAERLVSEHNLPRWLRPLLRRRS